MLGCAGALSFSLSTSSATAAATRAGAVAKASPAKVAALGVQPQDIQAQALTLQKDYIAESLANMVAAADEYKLLQKRLARATADLAKVDASSFMHGALRRMRTLLAATANLAPPHPDTEFHGKHNERAPVVTLMTWVHLTGRSCLSWSGDPRHANQNCL